MSQGPRKGAGPRGGSGNMVDKEWCYSGLFKTEENGPHSLGLWTCVSAVEGAVWVLYQSSVVTVANCHILGDVK